MSIETIATKISKQAIRMVNAAVNIAVLTAILSLLAIGCYAIWDSDQVYQSADAAHYEVYRPVVEDEGRSFEELRAINPEVFAWLTVFGTNIDYPVTQGPDNMKYVSTNAEGNYALVGSIFLDANSSQDFTDFSSILYGHHMEKQTMFGEIGLFADKSYFDARKYGMLYFNGQEHGLEIFAFLHADAYDGAVFRTKIEGVEAQQEYLNLLLETARYTRDIQVTTNDRIVLLSTCSASSTNGRDIVIARITDVGYDDPFIVKETVNHTIPAVDRISSLWAQAPDWARAALMALPPLLLLLWLVVALIRYGKRSRKSGNLKEHKQTPNEGDE